MFFFLDETQFDSLLYCYRLAGEELERAEYQIWFFGNLIQLVEMLYCNSDKIMGLCSMVIDCKLCAIEYYCIAGCFTYRESCTLFRQELSVRIKDLSPSL